MLGTSCSLRSLLLSPGWPWTTHDHVSFLQPTCYTFLEETVSICLRISISQEVLNLLSKDKGRQVQKAIEVVGSVFRHHPY